MAPRISVRFRNGLCAFGLLALFALDGRAKAKEPNIAGRGAVKTKYSALEIAQARPEGSKLVVTGQSGQRSPLTLDPALQHSARRLLTSARPDFGAFVAIEFKTGKLRVLSEWPAPVSQEQSLFGGRQFPAASVFKLVTTAALIEHAHVSPAQVVCTEGGTHSIELRHLEVPRQGVVQCRPFVEALGHSRNAVFAQLAHRYLNWEDLENYADRFGFGNPLPIEMSVPFGQFRSEVDPLTFARTATGFTGSTLSPLGAAYLAYVVANNGRAAPLQLLEENANDRPIGSESYLAIQPETAAVLRRMMELTVQGGTCWRTFHDDRGRSYLPHVSVAGKTGTLGEDDTTVSWFVGFAPSHRPEIVVSVLLKNGRVWHKKANEVARDWLVEYFAKPNAKSIARVRDSSPDRAGFKNAVALAAVQTR